MSFIVPEAVMRKVVALGPAGHAWAAGIGDTVVRLAREWQLTAGRVLAGGSGAVVIEVAHGDRPAVLKLAIPDGLDGHSDFAVELDALLVGSPDAYVEVFAFDRDARAMLLERLGRPLGDLDLPVESQIEVIASTLRHGWIAADRSCGLRSGAEQAASLIESIDRRWQELNRPCREHVVAHARSCLDARVADFDDHATVLVHGDAHPYNLLEVPGTSRFKLIDPDGMRSEPAHDLAIPLRDWSIELLVAYDPIRLARSWCEKLADLGGAPFDAVWQWAYAERVSTGLFATQLGHPIGAQLLAVAEVLIGG